MPHYMFRPRKKISRNFKISGTLIVVISLFFLSNSSLYLTHPFQSRAELKHFSTTSVKTFFLCCIHAKLIQDFLFRTHANPFLTSDMICVMPPVFCVFISCCTYSKNNYNPFTAKQCTYLADVKPWIPGIILRFFFYFRHKIIHHTIKK